MTVVSEEPMWEMRERQRDLIRASYRLAIAYLLGVDEIGPDIIAAVDVYLLNGEGEIITEPVRRQLMGYELLEKTLTFKLSSGVSLTGFYLLLRSPYALEAPGYVIQSDAGPLNLSSSDSLSITVNSVAKFEFDFEKKVFW